MALLFDGGFESGRFEPFIGVEMKTGAPLSHQFTVGGGNVGYPVRSGMVSARIQVHDGDQFGTSSGERGLCKLSGPPGIQPGDEFWESGSIFFSDFVMVPNSSWNIFHEIHYTNAVNPVGQQANSHLRVVNTGGVELFQLFAAGGPPASPTLVSETSEMEVERNVWYDWLMFTRYFDDANGHIEMWMNGELIAEMDTPTIYTGEVEAYMLSGWYRDDIQAGVTAEVFIDRVRRGEERADVESDLPVLPEFAPGSQPFVII